jgi:hypothetical protein
MNAEIEWNLNQGFAILILKLIEDVNKAASLGDREWFSALRILFRNVKGIRKMDANTMDILDIRMKKVGKDFEALEQKSKAYAVSIEKNIKKDLDEINLDLMNEINKAELIKFHVDKRDPAKSILNQGGG